MAEVTTKKITSLTEDTALNDTDEVPFGNDGGTILRRIKWSNIISAIKTKLGGAAVCTVVNNLITNVAGTVLDGRQGKILKDLIDANTVKLQVGNVTITTKEKDWVTVNVTFPKAYRDIPLAYASIGSLNLNVEICLSYVTPTEMSFYVYKDTKADIVIVWRALGCLA